MLELLVIIGTCSWSLLHWIYFECTDTEAGPGCFFSLWLMLDKLASVLMSPSSARPVALRSFWHTCRAPVENVESWRLLWLSRAWSGGAAKSMAAGACFHLLHTHYRKYLTWRQTKDSHRDRDTAVPLRASHCTHWRHCHSPATVLPVLHSPCSGHVEEPALVLIEGSFKSLNLGLHGNNPGDI